MLLLHAVGVGIEAEAVPVVLHSYSSAYRLACFGNGDDRTVEIVGEVAGIDVFRKIAVDGDVTTGFKRLWASVDDGDVVVVRHLIVVIISLHSFYRSEILVEIFLPCCGTLDNASVVCRGVVSTYAKGFDVGVSANVKHFQIGLLYLSRCSKAYDECQEQK